MQVERASTNLIPHQPNTRCQKCGRMFYVGEGKQRGTKRKYCGLRCRNAAYHARKVRELSDANLEIKQLKEKLKKAEQLTPGV